MAIFVDSDKKIEVKQAVAFDWVSGVTINPSLLAKAGLPPEEILDSFHQSALVRCFTT